MPRHGTGIPDDPTLDSNVPRSLSSDDEQFSDEERPSDTTVALSSHVTPGTIHVVPTKLSLEEQSRLRLKFEEVREAERLSEQIKRRNKHRNKRKSTTTQSSEHLIRPGNSTSRPSGLRGSASSRANDDTIDTHSAQDPQTRQESWEIVRIGRQFPLKFASFADAKRLSTLRAESHMPIGIDSLKIKPGDQGWSETTTCQTKLVGHYTAMQNKTHGGREWVGFHGAFEHSQHPEKMYLLDNATHEAVMRELSTMPMTRSEDPRDILDRAWSAAMLSKINMITTNDNPGGDYHSPRPRWDQDGHQCVNGDRHWWMIPHDFDSYPELTAWEGEKTR